MTDQIDPRHAALLVMDYQNGVVDMFGDPDDLLSRAANAIATVRRAGGHVGYVRVAFEDADFQAIPPTSRMGARVGTSATAFHNDSPATAVHDRVAPEPGDIIVRKVRVGAFSTTDLDAQLRERGVDDLPPPGRRDHGRRPRGAAVCPIARAMSYERPARRFAASAITSGRLQNANRTSVAATSLSS